MTRPLDQSKLIRQLPLKHDSLRMPVALRRVSPVTVCIAARSEGCIVGVSDRMLTSGDIQFEPSSTPKIESVSSSIAVMQSGDAAFNAEIMRDVKRVVTARIQQEPENWWLVEDIADLYVRYRNEAKRRRAEATLLSPLDLTLNNYREEITKFGEDNAQQLMRDLINFEVPHTAVIVTGIDGYGAHIYVVNDGEISCNDVVGFAAVGIGARHAESQFMLARHAWNSPLVDTALLAYIAKKRSEIAPGVGEATDMFSAGPGLGTLNPITEEGIEGFDEIFRKLKDKEGDCLNEARKQANDFVAQTAARGAEQAKGTQETGGEGEVPAIEDKSSVGFEGTPGNKTR